MRAHTRLCVFTNIHVFAMCTYTTTYRVFSSFPFKRREHNSIISYIVRTVNKIENIYWVLSKRDLSLWHLRCDLNNYFHGKSLNYCDMDEKWILSKNHDFRCMTHELCDFQTPTKCLRDEDNI